MPHTQGGVSIIQRMNEYRIRTGARLRGRQTPPDTVAVNSLNSCIAFH